MKVAYTLVQLEEIANKQLFYTEIRTLHSSTALEGCVQALPCHAFTQGACNVCTKLSKVYSQTQAGSMANTWTLSLLIVDATLCSHACYALQSHLFTMKPGIPAGQFKQELQDTSRWLQAGSLRYQQVFANRKPSIPAGHR